MTGDHVPDCLRLMRSMPEFFSPATIVYAARHLPTYHGFVCISDLDGSSSQLDGFISFHIIPERYMAKLDWMAVRPEMQGRGLGKELLRRIESELTDAQISTIDVYTLGTHPDYPGYQRTRAFYKQQGFVEVDRFRDKEDPSIEILILQKPLR